MNDRLAKFMQQEREFSSLPLEVEISFEEPFSNCYYTRTDELSDLGKSGLFGGDLDLLGETDEGFDENFQSLNSPFDWEVDEEFFKAELETGDCKSNGPTLAELNGERSRSPLINPEMERLHRVATRTDEQTTSSAVTKSPPQRLFEPKVSVEVFRPQVNRTGENVNGGKQNDAIEFGERFGRVVVKNEKPAVVEENGNPRCSTASTEIVPRSISNSCFGNFVPERNEKTHLNFPEERKLDGQQPCSIPNLVSPEMKLRLLSSSCPHADFRGQDQESDEAGEPYNMKIKVEPEESEDEEMDSYEEDFEEDNDNEEHEEFIYSKSRKGRRGDCDDLEPNPRRLLDIGRELERLNRIIGDLKPIHQLPVNARNKSRKEKNKLASRACRLKKKAQYEANKLKLHGLELEQQRLNKVMEQMKEEIVAATHQKPDGSLCTKFDILIKSVLGSQRVAGHTSQFVDSVLKATARDNCLEEIHLNV